MMGTVRINEGRGHVMMYMDRVASQLDSVSKSCLSLSPPGFL